MVSRLPRQASRPVEEVQARAVVARSEGIDERRYGIDKFGVLRWFFLHVDHASDCRFSSPWVGTVAR
jgi:hypothetical protein